MEENQQVSTIYMMLNSLIVERFFSMHLFKPKVLVKRHIGLWK